MKVYLCKYCSFKKKADGDNLCPRCAHYMSEQEFGIDTSWLDDDNNYNDEDEDN